MEEKFIRNISIICSIAGLALLFFISKSVELPQTKVNQITVDDIGMNTKLCGEIISKSVSKNHHVFFKLQDETGVIDIVAFNNSAKLLGAYDVKKNDYACIVGQVNEYQNRLELITKEKIQVMENVR